MRKATVLIAVSLLLCLQAISAVAWEVTDDEGRSLSINGHMQYRGRKYNLDFNDGSNAVHVNRQNYYGDISLMFTARPNDKITGVIEFNRLIFFGQQFRYNTIQTGEDVAPEDLAIALGDTTITAKIRQNTDEAWELHARQVWMDFQLFDYPVGLKFGRQPFMLGNGIYTNTNIATVFGYQFYSMLGEGKPFVRLGSMKFYESERENFNSDFGRNDADDIDMFFVDGSVPLGTNKLGMFVTYFNDRSWDLDRLYHYNIGLTADAELAGGITIKSEFDYQTGAKAYTDTTGAPDDIDWSGMAFLLNVGAPPIGPTKLNGELGYGTGDDPNTPDFEGYVGVGPFYPYAFAYEYRFLHAIYNSSNFYGQHSKGIYQNLAPGMENTTYLKAQAATKLPINVTWIFSPIYLRMTHEGEHFGTELDNIFVAPINPNLSYMFVLAYVIPSDYTKNTIAQAPWGTKIEDSAWCIRSQLEMKF